MAYKLAVLVALAAAATLSVDFTSSQTVFGFPYALLLDHPTDGSIISAASIFTTPEPDISKVWTNSITSACSSGFWYFYDHVDYNTGIPLQEGNVMLKYGIDFCEDFPVDGSWNVTGSFRYVGSPTGFEESGYSLYEGENCTGAAIYDSDDASDLGDLWSVQSIFLTGASNWTLYEEPNFANKICCAVPSFVEKKEDKTLYGMVLPHLLNADIKSIKKGCDPSPTTLCSERLAKNGATGSFVLPKQ